MALFLKVTLAKMFSTRLLFALFLHATIIQKEFANAKILPSNIKHQLPGNSKTNRGILIIGGYNGNILKSMEYFWPEDPSRNALVKAEMNVARFSHASVALPDGTILTVGGQYTTSTEIFDPLKLEVKAGPSMNMSRAYPSAAVLGETTYVCGGFDSKLTRTSSCEQKTKNGEWKYAAPMNQARNAFGFAVVDHYLYAIGGFDGVSLLKTVEKFDAETQKWSYVKPMPTALLTHASVIDGKIYAIGWDSNDRNNATLMYDPKTDNWTQLADTNLDRDYARLVALLGKLYVIGGWGGEKRTTASNTIESYDTKTDKWSMEKIEIIERRGVSTAVTL